MEQTNIKTERKQVSNKKGTVRHDKANQWIYVAEQRENIVKVGMSSDVEQRVHFLERTGGFTAKRLITYGPISNGYEVEGAIHKQLKDYRAIGEWFSISFETASAIAKRIFDEVGTTECREQDTSCDFEELMKYLFPNEYTVRQEDSEGNFIETYFLDEHGQLWIEIDDLGIFRADFMEALFRRYPCE